MAYSIQREVSNGTLQIITLRIKYFKKEHISVYVADKIADGTAGYSWVWDGDRIRMNVVIPNGVEVMIRRKTPMDVPFHTFRQGAVFKDVTMDENFIQQLYINQENVEGLSATDFYSDLDLHNYRLKNVGTAIANSDAVSLGQYKADALGANQQRILAERARDTAATYRDVLNTQATNAANSATTANAAKVSAESARDIAVAGAYAVASAMPRIEQFNGTYYGALGTTPSTDPNGNPCTAGDMYFDTTLNEMRVFSVVWKSAGSTTNGTSERYRFLVVKGATTFTGQDTNNKTLRYDVGFLDVFFNGVRLDQTDYIATNGTNITLVVPADTSGELNVVCYGNFTIQDTVTTAQFENLLSRVVALEAR